MCLVKVFLFLWERFFVSFLCWTLMLNVFLSVSVLGSLLLGYVCCSPLLLDSVTPMMKERK